jgi:hypothetical protein
VFKPSEKTPLTGERIVELLGKTLLELGGQAPCRLRPRCSGVSTPIAAAPTRV